jgi:DNA primase
MSAIDDIKDRIDIVDLVSASVKLRRSGKNYTGFCPFHPNTRTPAFVVFPESGTWRCFGACNEGGDIFRFVMKKEGWDFNEALRNLAQRAGVELPRRAAESVAEDATHQRLRDLMEASVVFYRHALLLSAAGQQVMTYLHERGLADAVLETFEIGYAPDSWDALHRHLAEREFAEQEMLDAGMLSEKEGGGRYDRFRNRIMIPIRDAQGRMAGFGARIVDPQDVPKFLNSPQTALFDKGHMLFGLDKARKAIRSADQAVIVEGYLDVMALHQAGFQNVVSPMGTALSEPQLRLLKKFSRRILLALDADAAGDKATLRGLDVARQAMDRELDPVFDARGLVRNEGRLDAELRVVTLPPGRDPDEVVAESREAWQALVSQARTVVDYVMDVLMEGRDLSDAKVKAEIAQQVLPLIDDVADPVERETYRQTLARRLRVDERALVAGRRPSAGERRQTARAAAPEARGEAGEMGVERFCLGLILQDPELLYRMDRQLQELGLERLSHRDFTGTDRQVIFQAAREALGQDQVDPGAHWRAQLPDAVRLHADALLEQMSKLGEVVDLDQQQRKVAEEVAARFLQLRKRNLEQSLSQIQFQLQAAQEETPGVGGERQDELNDMAREVQRLAAQKARLEQALARHQGLASQPLSQSKW